MSSTDPGVHHSAVYRTLSALLKSGAIGRIEALGGYVPTPDGHSLILVCDNCAAIEKIDGHAVHDALRSFAHDRGFWPHRYVTEVVGRCARCIEALLPNSSS